MAHSLPTRLSQLRDQAAAATAGGDLRRALELYASLELLVRNECGQDSRLWLDAVIALGHASVTVGELTRAAPALELAAAQWAARLEDGDSARVELCHLQALVCEARDGPVEALRHWAAAVEGARRLPERSEDLARLLSRYANALHAVGAVEDAVARTTEAARIERDAYGARSVEYVFTLSNLAKLLLEHGSAERAEAVAREALEIASATLDEAHPALPSVLETLGNVCLVAGRPAQAEPLLRRAVALRSMRSDPVRLLAVTNWHLARSLKRLDRTSDARLLLEQALDQLTDAPADRLAAAPIVRELAQLLAGQGDQPGAIRLFRHALEAQIAGGGASHPGRLVFVEALASALIAEGHEQEAESLLVEGLESSSQTAPADDRIVALWTLGRLYTVRLDAARARQTLEQARDLARSAHGEHSVAFANALNQLATLHWSLDEPRKAEPLIRASLAIMRQLHGDRHPELVGLLLSAADVCDASGRPDDAREYRRRALATVRQLPAAHQAACEDHLLVFAEYATQRGDDDTVIELVEALVAVREAVFGRGDARCEQAVRALESVKARRRAERLPPGTRHGEVELLATDDPRVSDDLRVMQRAMDALLAGDYPLVVRAAQLRTRSVSRHVLMALLVSLLFLKRDEEAHNLGGAAIGWTAGDPWTQSMLMLLLRRVDPDAVLARAADAEQRAQARYYRSVLAARDPDPAARRTELQACLSERAEGLESMLAQHELARMDKPVAHPRVAVQRAIDELAREMESRLEAGRFQEALQIAQEARYRARRRLGPQHPTYADTLIRAGICWERTGAREQADSLIAEAMPILRSQLGDAHPHVQAYVEQLTGRCHEAYLERAPATCLSRAVPLLPLVGDERLMVVVLPSLQAIRNDAEYAVLLAAVLRATAGHPAHHALVRVAVGHTRPADALSLLESDSQRCEAWLYAGRFLESEGRIPDAIAAYEACIAVDPDAPESKIARSAVQLLHEHGETAAGDAGSRANALVRQAEALLAHGDARSAASLLEDAMRIHATHSGEQTVGYASLVAWLAKARAAEGSFDTAEELSRRAVALATAVADGSVQVWALGGLGEIQRARGRVDEAESAFRQAVEIAASAYGRESPLCIDATFKLARLLYGVWESNRGGRELAEASRLNAELVPLLRALAGEHSVQHGDALFNLALCRKDSGANEDALALLDRAAQVYAELGHGYVVQRARCHGTRSAVLRQLDRPADAGEALQRALEVMKDSERPEPALRSELLQALADVFDSQDRVLDSIPLLEEAAALQVATTREGRTAWARLALAHHRRGDFARARPLYELAFGLPAGDESAPDREDVDAR